ncbi:MAG: P-II family nitrogen regulator [SAR202 cluster bacterium]|nr:P-II family nitrogen regulator [SAR202 cluster bacterium]
MKKIEAIVRPERVQPVVEALEAIGILGLNVTQVTGRGRQKGVTVHTGRGVETTQVNMLPKARVEVVVADADVDKVIAAVIRAARTNSKGAVGDGKIFVSPVNDAVRVSTGERGDSAI